MSEEESPVEEIDAQPTGAKGLYLLGVQRAKSWRGRRVTRDEVDDTLRVRYRDLEAIVRPAVFEVPAFDQSLLHAHQRAVESAMRRGTILPAPYGIVFHGRRPLIRMLQNQYLVIDEALSFLNGHCEVRVHINAVDGVEPDDELLQVATQVYSDLRRSARAAVPFAREGRRLLSSAFLVEKTAWVEFVQRAEDLAGAHSDLAVDVTGPWAPYDFVRFVV
ncbi:MAG TPA: GvpL/GvpF family gas vesicle protein [Longimicrobiales bacterium]|nr:GvpL/GvpF family gas vesicle protein [Longimicrobiales bacterium]